LFSVQPFTNWYFNQSLIWRLLTAWLLVKQNFSIDPLNQKNERKKTKNEPVNEPVNHHLHKVLVENGFYDISKAIIAKMTSIVHLIDKDKSLNRNAIATQLNFSASTTARYVRMLIASNVTIFKGKPKTGHYELTLQFSNLIQKN